MLPVEEPAIYRHERSITHEKRVLAEYYSYGSSLLHTFCIRCRGSPLSPLIVVDGLLYIYLVMYLKKAAVERIGQVDIHVQ